MNTATAYSWLTGIIKTRENLKVFARLYNVENPEERIDYLMKLLDIDRLRNKKTYSLSSGETTRLNIAKGLINKPEVLLLDECTVGLDPVVARRIRKVLKDLQKKEKTTILFTTHLMKEAEELCDRIAFISHGKIIKIGTPKTLKKIINKQIIRIDFMPTKRSIEKFLKKQGFDVLYVKNNRAAIGVKHAAEQLHKVIHPILKAGFKIKDLHIRKPTIEDVFVKITGESL
jgi:ABC-2 type transport system ATP-binding protein